MSYPFNVPSYNKLRLPTPDAVDETQRQVVVVLSPTEYWEYLNGQMSALGEVNIWQQRAGALTAQDAVDIYNNEVQFVYDLCDFVNECLKSLGEGEPPAEPDEGAPPTDGPQRGDAPGVSEEPLDDQLDCIWAATGPAFEVFDDFVTSAIAIAQSAVDALAQYDDNVTLLLRVAPNLPVKVAEQLSNAVAILTQALVNDLDAARQQQAVEDAWRCSAFCSVKQRGVPYTLTRADMVDAVGAWTRAVDDNSAVPLAIIRLLAQFIRTTWQVGLLLTRWSISTDDACNNNWQTLCDCPQPPQTFTVTFDSSGYQDYVNEDSKASNFGNPAPSLEAERTGGAGDTSGVAVVNLDATRQVDQIAMDCHYVTDNGTLFARVSRLDDNDNVLDQETIGQSGSGWRTVQFSMSGPAKKLKYQVGRASGFNPDEIYADNLTWRQQ
jgi:hypothetical protein